jgi:hypothetical protein
MLIAVTFDLKLAEIFGKYARQTKLSGDHVKE